MTPRPEPPSNQLALFELHIQAITALVLDIGTGRIRPATVESADDAKAVGLYLINFLCAARAAT